MSWFVRISRFASVHMVRSQDLDNSCAMSSIIMTNFKIKKGLIAAGMAANAAMQSVPVVGSFVGYQLMQAAIKDAIRSEKEVYKLYEQVSGSVNHDFATQGADRSQYFKIMEKLGLGRWEAPYIPEGDVCQAVIDATADGTPVILSIAWDGGGGHAVVCDEVHSFFGSTYLCICDPWDGELRIVKATPGSAITYDVSTKPWSVTFGGDRHEYPPGSKGKVRGWIMRKVK